MTRTDDLTQPDDRDCPEDYASNGTGPTPRNNPRLAAIAALAVAFAALATPTTSTPHPVYRHRKDRKRRKFVERQRRRGKR